MAYKSPNDNTDFASIGISLASPEQILRWSHGEVKKPETINYRTLKPEADGLFCERIFGPTKDYECHCGKYKKLRFKGIVCDRCGVEVTKSKVRRERMGHIELAAPCSHIWYFRGTPCRMGLVLDMKPKDLEKILYFVEYVVLDPGITEFTEGQIINESEYREAMAIYGKNSFDARMGAEAIRELLKRIDLEKLHAELKAELVDAKTQKRQKLVKRLEVIEAFLRSGNRPEWMILTVLPVLPPDLRPMVQLDGGRFATSDLNDLYRRVINRNNRMKKLLSMGAPGLIIRNEKRMLQEAVDALIDNGRRGRAITGAGNRDLKSLTDLLKGKQGRFRQNLLGKRVDYSGRSVIVIGPELKMHQCGLPKEMALELFKPYVMHEVVKAGEANNIKSAKRIVEKADDKIWDILDDVIKDKAVLLNRAPTLHRLGIQAFEPVLVEGRAIKLHPLFCTAYNADFDGDQMAVHLPLSAEAQAEARFLMLAANNLLKPQDGKPVTVPTQDMVLGCYYLTMHISPIKDENGDQIEETEADIKAYSSFDEAKMAYDNGKLTLHQTIKVKVEKEDENTGQMIRQVVETTLGRLIFNSVLPQDLGYVDRSIEGNELVPECNFIVGKKKLGEIIDRCIRKHGLSKTSAILDNIKTMGYHYSTVGGISIGVFDMDVPVEKDEIIRNAQKAVDAVNLAHGQGMLKNSERYKRVIQTWEEATADITERLKKSLKPTNPVNMMSDSGARGNINQLKQLAGMRGNMMDTSGQTIEIPIKSNLREGMNVLEFFISSHGTRKSLSDMALKTADSGYLTRRLVDISQDVIIREDDCGTENYVEMTEIVGNKNLVIEKLEDRITGRCAAKEIRNPKTGELIIFRNEMITADHAKAIVDAGIKSVPVRTNLTCEAHSGVCSKCYGMHLATGKPAVIGEAVGIIAAQSIGEPGTQLTMRTFHQGGIAAGDDITQGLPRVEELFEARNPKGQAIISEIAGICHIEEGKRKGKLVRITGIGEDEGQEVSYDIPVSVSLTIEEGDKVAKAEKITEGSVNPHDLMKISGTKGVEDYILVEVLKVYKNNGVDINDKHIEIIIRQMLRKVRVDDSGDTDLPIGTLVDLFAYLDANKKAEAEGLKPAQGERVLLGITKAALATESFLSAASFQEQTRVLTDAAVKGKVDPLVGLKENVIIGKLIPAGTGLPCYNDITAVPLVYSNSAVMEKYGSEEKGSLRAYRKRLHETGI